MAVLENVEPKKVFQFFEEICQIPHGTFDIERISDYCAKFAEDRGLKYIQDEVKNVIIFKPGTEGYEDSEPVILQGHMDMVCEKTPDSDHDFKKDPLDLYIEDGYIRAKNTTLGGDDGIALAMAMALLDSDDIPHPPIEAVFTVDEETGMGGAIGVDLSVLKGHKLINIDSEEEGILTTGCAGGIRITTEIPVTREEKSGTCVKLELKGLKGGHSGSEIHEQRGNAHKLMGRLLHRISEEMEFELVDIQGGSKENVIAMDNTANIVAADAKRAVAIAEEMKEVFDNEFMGDEPGLTLTAEVTGEGSYHAFDKASTERIVTYLIVCPYGVQGFSRKLEGLTETSINIGVMKTTDDTVVTEYLMRSSVESLKQNMRIQLEEYAKLIGAKTTIDSEYPAWQYDPDSELRKVMERVYTDMYGKAPVVFAIHAGLECGMFLGKRPDLDCVSMGPNMCDIHSFSEKLDIASTERTWDYLKAVLAALK